jgi:Kdo2-lipid IVA lauroyltransferase/acyltransferase
MRLGKRIKRSVVYLLVKFFFFFINIIPRRLALKIGSGIGKLTWRFSKKDRSQIEKNLSWVYKDQLTPKQRDEISREFFIFSGKNLIDVLRFKKHFKTELLPLVTVEGIEYLHEAFKRGKGLLGISGHIGNFELLAAYLSTLGYDAAVIAREMYDKRIDEILVSNRTSIGLTNISTTDSPIKIVKWLKKNGGVGVLIDTDSHRVKSEFIEWFGKPAYTPVGQTMLGIKTGSAFIPMACVRIDDNRYHIIIKPIIDIPLTGDISIDTKEITSACVRELEQIINDYKSQWIWLHDRWHTKQEKTS